MIQVVNATVSQSTYIDNKVTDGYGGGIYFNDRS